MLRMATECPTEAARPVPGATQSATNTGNVGLQGSGVMTSHAGSPRVLVGWGWGTLQVPPWWWASSSPGLCDSSPRPSCPGSDIQRMGCLSSQAQRWPPCPTGRRALLGLWGSQNWARGSTQHQVAMEPLGCPIRPSPASHSFSAQFGDTAGVTPRWVTRVSCSLPCLCHGRHLNSKDEGGRLGAGAGGTTRARCLCSELLLASRSGSPIPGLLPLSSLPVRVGDPSLLLPTGNERLSMHKAQESPCRSLLGLLAGQAGRGRRHLFLLLPWWWGAP